MNLIFKKNMLYNVLMNFPRHILSVEFSLTVSDLFQLIDHYHNKQDGLLCKLSEPCPSPGFDPVQLQSK